MPKYKYTAKNPATGKKETAVLEGSNTRDVAKAVKDSGLIPIDIKADTKLLGDNKAIAVRRIKSKDKVLFARQLSTLINAGLPLAQALRSVSEQTTNKAFRAVIDNIVNGIEGGKPLSQALSKYPNVFSRVFISMVEAGETSGTLDKQLERVAIQQEKDADTISKIRGAMIYPAIVLVVMLLVVTFMIVKVVPQIQLLYTSFPGAHLPILTRVLIDLSKIIKKLWWVVILAVIFGGFGLWRWFKTDRGSRILDAFKYNAPPFKELFRKIYMARFCRTTASLIGAGVPLLQVMQITSDTVANYYVSNSIKRAAEKVRGGTPLGDALTGDAHFLPLVTNMLKIGEKSGTVEDMMTKCAEYYESEIENIIKNISATIEPILMVILGVVAILIIISILLPIYGLAGSGGLTSGSGV